jgi:uroporphyrinogen-III decarboxylase
MHLLMWVMDVQPTLMAMIDEEDKMSELLAAMHEKNKEYYRLAAAGPGRILRPMEDTSSMLTGPAMYARHCVPMLNDYARITHDAGKLFIPHMCGHLDGMLDVLKEVELDGIEAVTPPPLGNANLPRIREKLGDIWIIGGVDPSRYASTDRQEIVSHVKTTLQQMRGDRKFMLGSEEIPLAAKMENVQAVAELVQGTAGGFY